MVENALREGLAWLPLIALLAVPWLITVPVALAAVVVQRRLEQTPDRLDCPAGAWLVAEADAYRAAVDVEIHEDWVDGFWPDADVIGLTHRTASSVHPVHRAIAAHELGHALNVRLAPGIRAGLTLARAAVPVMAQIVAATVLVGAMYDASVLLQIGEIAAIAAAVTASVVLLDETAASAHGWQVLRDDPGLDARTRALGLGAMASAWTVYLATLAGQVLLVALWPWVEEAALGGGAPSGAPGGEAAVWLLFCALPVLCLHAAWTLQQTFRPDPVRSGFRLMTAMERESRWEFLSGLGALGLIVGLYDHGAGSWFVAAVALAAITAVKPAATLARAFVVLPVLLVAQSLRGDRVERPPWLAASPVVFPEEPRAIMELWSHPPLHVRARRLLQVSYAPMVLILLAQLALP